MQLSTTKGVKRKKLRDSGNPKNGGWGGSKKRKKGSEKIKIFKKKS